MITRPLPRSAALVGAMGAILLAGCAPADTTSTDTTSTETDGATDSGSTSESSASYTDGSYTADGTYSTPETVETISVTITLEEDIVTEVSVTGDPQAPESEKMQGAFIGGISDEVVGKDVDEISVSRVAGSSLTSGGFNDALEKIKAEAAA